MKPTITKADGKVVAVTMTDDEHRVHEILWEAPKPLSDEEMMKVIEQVACSYDPYEIEISYDYEVRIARAIEERHGIK